MILVNTNFYLSTHSYRMDGDSLQNMVFDFGNPFDKNIIWAYDDESDTYQPL